MVRPGLLVYGMVPPGKRPLPRLLNPQLRPALSLKSRVSLIKKIGPGTPLSYGQSFVAPTRMRVATITAGYGDGYPRAAGNRAAVLIGGRRCAILGRVTMDQLLADVSRVDGVKAGDEVILIGRQGNDEITASQLACWGGTVPWEILTTISYRVTRVYRGAQAA
jgi:alanine racemase